MQTQTFPKEAKGTGVFDGVTPYHWLVVIIASLGWLFDCMDQRLFVLARESALKELLQNDAAALAEIKKYIGYATTSMILGWATGGIIFGMMSDKMGRVKTMVATLLVYSGFTGLSGFSQGWVDFTVYRFLVGLGVGARGTAGLDGLERLPVGYAAADVEDDLAERHPHRHLDEAGVDDRFHYSVCRIRYK